MKIGLVTCREVAQLEETERSLPRIFNRHHHIEAVVVVWNDPKINWDTFDYLIIRSIWDYHLNVDAFLKWIDYLDEHTIKSLNSTNVLRSNYHKFYLSKLQNRGIHIVPTVFLRKSENLDLSFIKSLGWEKAVIKPAVSASSYLTQVIDIDKIPAVQNKYTSIFKNKDLLVQRFMPEVQSHGEISMIFFNRQYSHSVLKIAEQDEFRVQSEYGGKTVAYLPSKMAINTAHNILKLMDGDILYARIDGLIVDERFVLMEIELIEPHLFLDFGHQSHTRFVNAALDFIRQ